MPVLPVFIMCATVAAIVLSIEAGHQVGLHHWFGARQKTGAYSTIEAAIFGLMGLLIAFTFYGAAARFDIRRNLIVQEANAIGTAYLRLDLLPPEVQPELRVDFRKYVTSRLAVHRKIPDMQAVKAELARSKALQDQIWKKAVAGTKTVSPAAQSLVLGALNEMIDITTVRTVAGTTHPPLPVFAMLGLSVLISAVLAGYGMSASGVRDWVSTIAFTLVLSTAVYIILDYEFPRIGIIRIDPVDEVLVQTLEQMK